jgi:hypothetical protein
MKIFLITTINFLCLTMFSQEIENVAVEQDENKVNIYYDLTGNLPGQIYEVFISCSVDGGTRFVLKSVSGDVGKYVTGGLHKKIVWDAFQDVSSLNEAQFFIRAEPMTASRSVSPDSKTYKKTTEFFIGYNGSSVGYIGLRMGSINNWGGYMACRTSDFMDYSIVAGADKRLFRNNVYLYSGLGAGNWGYTLDVGDDDDYWLTHHGLEFEFGVLAKYRHIYLTLGPAFLFGRSSHNTYDITFGIGYAFTADN